MILSTTSGKVVIGLSPLMSSWLLITVPTSLDEFIESNELCAGVGSGGIQEKVGVVKDLLLATILDSDQDLSNHLWSLEDNSSVLSRSLFPYFA